MSLFSIVKYHLSFSLIQHLCSFPLFYLLHFFILPFSYSLNCFTFPPPPKICDKEVKEEEDDNEEEKEKSKEGKKTTSSFLLRYPSPFPFSFFRSFLFLLVTFSLIQYLCSSPFSVTSNPSLQLNSVHAYFSFSFPLLLKSISSFPSLHSLFTFLYSLSISFLCVSFASCFTFLSLPYSSPLSPPVLRRSLLSVVH